jgi:hypothetical protein
MLQSGTESPCTLLKWPTLVNSNIAKAVELWGFACKDPRRSFVRTVSQR